MERILIACLALLPPFGALAQDAAPAPAAPEPPAIVLPAPSPDAAAEEKSVQAWGRDNPDCAEWGDACVVCTKEACSTPGISCTPKETACRRK